MQIGLIGHKIDSSRREVSSQEGEQFAVKEHLLYAETTINDPLSITLAFKKLVSSIFSSIQAFCRRRARTWVAGPTSCG